MRAPVGAMLAAAFACALSTGCDADLRFDTVDADAGGDATPQDGNALEASEGKAGDAGACRADRDCPLESLHCDVSSGHCVPCVTAAHCADPSTSRCDTALHRCVACGVDGDCAAGDVCEPTVHACVPSCGGAVQCVAQASRCDPMRAVCIECTTDGECSGRPPRRICHVAAGICVQCLGDAQCTATVPRCHPLLGACVACVESTDCSPGTACDPRTHGCVARRQ